MKLNDVFTNCQNTGSWFGLKISSVFDKNDFDDTPLHTVCRWGDLESVKILLDAGADINAIGDQGATPIFNAVGSKNIDLIRFLLKHGASKQSRIFGDTSLYNYAKNIGASEDILKIIK